MSGEISIKTNHVFILAFLEGAFVMALELVGARFLAPFFGSSIIVWTIILTTVVTSLAIGYFVGGRLAKKSDLLAVFGTIALAAATIVTLLPNWASFVGNMMMDSGHTTGVFISSVLILLIPNMLLGTIPPLLIELLYRSKYAAGKGSGYIYGISTVGGIFATFLFGFYLIPEYGLRIPMAVYALIFAVVVLILVVLRQPKNQLFFIQTGLGGIALISTFFASEKIDDDVILYHSEGLLGQVIVADIPHKWNQDLYPGKKSTDRVLFVNRMGQTWVDNNTKNAWWPYAYYLNVVTSCYPENSDILLLGLGGGTVARNLERQHFNVDAVELDGRMKEVAKKHFDYNSRKSKVDDARHFLRATKKKYDIIIFDVFKGEVAPSYVLTKEAFIELKERLNPNGMVIINFNGFIYEETGKAGRSVYKTLQACGYQVEMLPTDGTEASRNMLYIASVEPIDFSNQRVRYPNINKDIPDLFMSADSILPGLDDAIILTDDKPNLEILNIQASQSWRREYKETIDSLDGIDFPVYK